MTLRRIFVYSALLTMFFETSWFMLLYGRPSMILSAVAASMPGSVMRSSLLAMFRSSFFAFAVAAAFSAFAWWCGMVLFDAAAVVVPADAASGMKIATVSAPRNEMRGLRFMRGILQRACLV